MLDISLISDMQLFMCLEASACFSNITLGTATAVRGQVSFLLSKFLFVVTILIIHF